ncbi:MAG: 16S rRNA (uracil(1498)-N(3))-methyltransferase [Bdellovibrionota bacterium]
MSQIFRLFEPTSFAVGSNVTVFDDSHHILTKVLRMQSGDPVELLDGNGKIAQASILSVDKKSTVLNVLNVRSFEPIKPSIRLFIGCLKGEKLSFVTQKATELGIDEIGFFNSQHSVAMKSESFLDKTHKTLIETLRQSGNPFLPKASFFKKLTDVPFSSDKDHWNVVLDETETQPFTALMKQDRPQSVSLFVGPEGGFSSQERDFFREKKCKFVRIAPYVLRADTAAISAVSLFRASFGIEPV